MGEVQLFIRHGDKCLPVMLPLTATVGDVMKAAQEVASLKSVPALTYQGDVLEDPSKPVADVGVCNQSTLEVLPTITVTVGPYGSPGDSKEHEISATATLEDLIEQLDAPAPGAIPRCYLGKPDMSFECVLLVPGSLREQGVESGGHISTIYKKSKRRRRKSEDERGPDE
eukprot:Hpha_TRINITY_DN16749_c1_g2::TRINITY_DN16749_c1_g2_i1::g.77499::m.77499